MLEGFSSEIGSQNSESLPPDPQKVVLCAMNPSEIKRLFLKLFIGFLSLTAAIAIFSVLSGDFGEFQLKVLATTFSVSAASICSMSCAAFIEKRRRKELGMVGIALSIIGAVLVIGGLWLEINEDGYWKVALSCVVFAVAVAHAFLLVLPELDVRHRWSQGAACVCIGVLSLQIVGAILGEVDSEGYYRLLAASSIVVVLLTLVIPILMKIGGRGDESPRVLALTENPDGTYCDPSGAIYKVTRVTARSDQ